MFERCTYVGFIGYYCLLFALVFGKLNKERPLNGKGKILISSFTQNNDFSYNQNKLIVSFSLMCLQSDNDDDYQAILNEKMNMFESKYDCLKHDNHTHFRQNDKVFSFLNIDDIQCIHDSNVELDYNDHCIDFFLFEPVFYLQSYNVFNDTNDFNCTAQDASAYEHWGLDALSGQSEDGTFTYPSTLETIDNGVDLVILDSGVLDTHVEFYEGQVIHVIGDGPFISYYGNYTLYQSHGTHVAGIAAGINVGVSKGTTIYDYLVCDDLTCPLYWVWSAYDDVLNELGSNGIFEGRRIVINFSITGLREAFELYEYYFKEIQALGGIIVAAAGNSGDHSCEYAPAYSDYAFSVGAYDSNFTAASFSNFGECNDIWAPGVDIYSAIAYCDTCYAFGSGTSMASPHIAGMIANILYVNPTLTFSQIRTILYENAFNVTDCKQHESDASTCYAATYECDRTYNNIDEYVVEVDDDIPNDVYRHNNNDKDCSTLVVDEYDTVNDTFTFREYYAIDTCYGSRDWEGDNEYSIMYKCNYTNNTVQTKFYDSADCSNESSVTVVGTIYDGYFDGKYKYFVDCNADAEENDELYCSLKLRFWYNDDLYCSSVNETKDKYEDVIYMNGFCMDNYVEGYGNYSELYECIESEFVKREVYSDHGCLAENMAASYTFANASNCIYANASYLYESPEIICPEQWPTTSSPTTSSSPTSISPSTSSPTSLSPTTSSPTTEDADSAMELCNTIAFFSCFISLFYNM